MKTSTFFSYVFVAFLLLNQAACQPISNGNKDIRLAKDTTIQSITFTNHIEFYPSGALESGKLAKETIIQNHTIPAYSTVVFNEDGTLKMVFLAHDASIQNITCNGGGHNWMQTFHSNGNPEILWLTNDQTIQGIPCKHASFWTEFRAFIFRQPNNRVEFNKEGKLIRCKIAQNCTIQGKAYHTNDIYTTN